MPFHTPAVTPQLQYRLLWLLSPLLQLQNPLRPLQRVEPPVPESSPIAEAIPPAPESTSPTAEAIPPAPEASEPASQAIEPGPAPEPASPAAEPEPTWIEEPVSEEKIATLEGVYFPFDSYRFTPEELETLDQHVVILEEHPEIKVEIGGHTDSRGTISYNRALSRRRARAVKLHLISKGISRERLMVKAYGGSRPVASNETEEGRAENSRVELNVLQ